MKKISSENYSLLSLMVVRSLHTKKNLFCSWEDIIINKVIIGLEI